MESAKKSGVRCRRPPTIWRTARRTARRIHRSKGTVADLYRPVTTAREFRRGGGERRDLALVKGDARRRAEPMGKDAKQHCHYYRKPDRCLAWQMHFLLQINQP